MARRSLDRALMDTQLLIADLRPKAIAITIYGADGSCTLQVNPPEFLRLHERLGGKVDLTMSEEGNLHAQFVARKTRFSCVCLRNELDALTRGTNAAGRIGAQRPLLSHAERAS